MKREKQRIKVLVTAASSVQLKEITIDFTAFGWHTIIHSIYHSGKVHNENFPKEAGPYTLIIKLADSLIYQEIALYRLDLNREELTFHFYHECGKLFCRISSHAVIELNKVILMNPIDPQMKKILDDIDE